MLKLHYPKKDPYRLEGINHFSNVYGIPLKISDNPRENDIEIVGNKIHDHIVSWTNTKYGRIPLFEETSSENLVESTEAGIRLNFDLFNVVGHILSGHTEHLPTQDKKEIARVPFLDIYERILYDEIIKISEKKGLRLQKNGFWPGNKKFAVCLTHDVDEIRKTYQYFTRSVMHARDREFDKSFTQIQSFVKDKINRINPYWTFDEIMDLEDSLGVRSSFYFLQEDAKVDISDKKTWRHKGRRYKFNDPRMVEVTKKLNARGWEVGLHGSFHSFNNEKKLGKEKHELEKASGIKIIGTRQHNLNLKIPETWRHHESLKIEYDTTLGSNHYLGFRYGTCFPFYPIDMETKKQINVLQIPLIIEDIPAFRIKNLWEECVRLIEHVESMGGVLTLLWHHSVFNSQEFPNWIEMYVRIIEYCKEKNAWVTSGKEINNWWRSRNV